MNGCRNTLSYIGHWVGLSAVAAVAAWFLHISFLTFINFIVENDALRPTYWGAHTLGPASRASILVMGSCWLIFMIWLERALRLANKEGKMWRLAGRLTVALGAVLVMSYVYITLNA